MLCNMKVKNKKSVFNFIYLKNNLSKNVNHLKRISPVNDIGFMGLDEYTIRNLEVF